MSEWVVIVILTLLAGIAISVGGSLAAFENIRRNWLKNELRHGVMAFGGGALLAAVALVLVPEGSKDLPIWATALSFILGGLVFMVLDIVLARNQTSASQLVAMLADFIPEALALGATFVIDKKVAPLLAGIMALQNLPEGFNAFREIKTSTHYSARKIIIVFVLIAFLGPIAGLSGYWLLSDFQSIVAAIMLFAAGGITYIIFQDIAPQAKLESHWSPPIFALLGFLLGLIGQQLST
ncbi:MAG: ZIP family metal transporter [Marinicella pacifica]|jgi:ZIP family zinc transporter